MAPVHPCRAQDEVARVGRAHRRLAIRLGAAVHAERRDRIVLRVSAFLAAVEHVVGGQVQDRRAGRRGGMGEHARALRIGGSSARRLAFGPVHGGVGGGVDDEARGRRRDEGGDGVGVGDVGLGALDAPRGYAPRRRQRHQLLPDLAGGAEHQQAHVAAPPKRSPRYTPARMRLHQAGLSRYQRTVLRRPVSKVSCGIQPSSRLILPASMA